MRRRESAGGTIFHLTGAQSGCHVSSKAIASVPLLMLICSGFYMLHIFCCIFYKYFFPICSLHIFLLLFVVYFSAPQPAGSSSPTRDGTCAPALGGWSLTTGAAGQSPSRHIWVSFTRRGGTCATPLIGSVPNSSAKLPATAAPPSTKAPEMGGKPMNGCYSN